MAKKKSKKAPIQLNEVIEKEIDFRYQKVVSFTQFQMFQQCNHRWANQYGRKLFKTKPNINMTFGTAMHETIQEYMKTMYTESGAAADRMNLEEIFGEKFRNEYIKSLENNNKEHFSTPEEMNEFYEDGIAILDWFKKNRRKYFSNTDTYLVGIEMPLQTEVRNNIIFTGFVDLVLYEERLKKLIIYDIKTSTKGWNDYSKKDETKTSQVLLYKKLFSELYGFDINFIEVEFFILKRKIEPNEFQEFPRRIQTFRPTAGPRKIKETQEKFNKFLQESFDEKGKFIEKEYEKNITKLCEWCPFYKTDHCRAHSLE